MVAVLTVAQVFFGPPDWLIDKVDARTRRAFGFWTVVFAVFGTVLLKVFEVSDLWWLLWLTVLSILALIPNFSSETPVEEE